jgi:hypothetical protein
MYPMGDYEPPKRIELLTSFLPRMRSTTELRRHMLLNNNYLYIITYFYWRVVRDSNPRWFLPTTVFKTITISQTRTTTQRALQIQVLSVLIVPKNSITCRLYYSLLLCNSLFFAITLPRLASIQ